MKCLEMQELCVLKGQALEIDIPVLDDDGDPVDLSSGFTIQVGLALSSREAYLHDLPTEVVGDDSNVIRATLSHEVTEGLAARPHYFSAWVTSLAVRTPVARGILHVKADSRVA